MLQADPDSDRRTQPATGRLGQLLFDRVSDHSLPADRLVRTKPFDATSQTAQPATLSPATGHLLESAPPESWSGCAGGEMNRATACACLRRELSGEPDAGNPHVRFDEGRGDVNPSYSTGWCATPFRAALSGLFAAVNYQNLNPPVVRPAFLGIL